MAMMQTNGANADDDNELLPDSTADFPLLDTYDDVASSVGQARPDALATISAGERGPDRDGKPGLPKVSRDGTIFLHDPDSRAPGLLTALRGTGMKRLTVAFPYNSLPLFWQERFARYSATRLEVYGDSNELREIVLHGQEQPAEHVLHLAGSPEYERLRRTCKVSTSIYFCLATWDGMTPRIVFPDGLGLYRLRTTSRHSRRSLLGALQTVSRFTGGALAGVPFELSLTYREVADPQGAKRNIPVWSLMFKPPQQIALSTKTWAGLRDAALAEGRTLSAQPALAPPSAETWQQAQAEGDVPLEPSDADLANMLAGDSPADEAFWRRTWFAVTDHTIYAQENARHKFFERYTEGKTASLAGFLETATNGQAEAMIRAAVDELKMAAAVGAPTDVEVPDTGTAKQRTAAENARRYEEIFGSDAAADFLPDSPPAEEPVIEGEDPITTATSDHDSDFLPVDADVREASRQWLLEVHRLITEQHVNQGGSSLATPQQQRAAADLLLATVEGDVGKAARLLRILTTGAPEATSTARKLTRAQALVIADLAKQEEWSLCCDTVLEFAVVAA